MGRSMTRFERIRWRELSPRDREIWRAFREADASLRSPYFDLGWFDAVDRARGDLHVVRAVRGSEPIAFFAFHPGLLGVARPAGGTFCDWQGIVQAPDGRVDAREMLGAGLASFHFSAAPAADLSLAPHADATGASNLMNMASGFDLYARPKTGAAPKAIANLRRANRKLVADGRVVELLVRDVRPETLESLMALKSAQYRRTGFTDLFAWSWSRRLLHALMQGRSDDFEPLLSSLWIDGRLAAAHLGLRSGPVLHHWLPAFDRELAHYAPGHVLTLEVARALAAESVTEIDLGQGEVAWKKEFSNAHAPVIKGVVHAANPLGRVNAAAFGIGRRWSRLPLGVAARAPHALSWRLERQLGRFARPPVAA
jgi:CelD/BcsL family acetyltransferase involved in cellulose biosynthesis